MGRPCAAPVTACTRQMATSLECGGLPPLFWKDAFHNAATEPVRLDVHRIPWGAVHEPGATKAVASHRTPKPPLWHGFPPRQALPPRGGMSILLMIGLSQHGRPGLELCTAQSRAFQRRDAEDAERSAQKICREPPWRFLPVFKNLRQSASSADVTLLPLRCA